MRLCFVRLVIVFYDRGGRGNLSDYGSENGFGLPYDPSFPPPMADRIIGYSEEPSLTNGAASCGRFPCPRAGSLYIPSISDATVADAVFDFDFGDGGAQNVFAGGLMGDLFHVSISSYHLSTTAATKRRWTARPWAGMRADSSEPFPIPLRLR